MIRSRIPGPLFVAGLTVVAVTGCTAPLDGGDDTPAPSPQGTPCYVGEWELDLDAAAEEATSTLEGFGLDLTELELDGSQTLVIGAPEGSTGEFSVDSDLTAVATVDGEPVAVPLSGSGSGVYAPDGDAGFMVESWTFETDDDTTAPLGIPFQGGVPVTVDACSESELVLGASTANAGLSATYVRQG